ncbi:HD family phosphohydrolase [Gordonia sp. SL306]|uniref:HD family phosphohydrolase n=1 Tax=Gordonia sp. SL306 TaxID=2995145 RepID=UPI00226F0370|nr:HD family phosphohydrolase [Gordonia sp. SL306]WAC54406.1 HD family phosphohydrolase [Gordonia sp. SL306]
MSSSSEIAAEVTAVLRSLRGIWDEPTVDELDHAMQAGWHAQADSAPDDLVLAAVLHDVGRSPLLPGPEPHDRIAREWLTPRFGARVGWLAGAHVAAKRFLAATESGYAAGLSETSVDSLAHQGGAGGVDASWTAHPWWTDAIRLRRYDDAAKVVGAPGMDIVEAGNLAGMIADRLVVEPRPGGLSR